MAKLELDSELMTRLSEEDEREYRRLTAELNSEAPHPLVRWTYAIGGILTAIAIIVMIVAMTNSTDGGRSVLPFLIATVSLLFATIVVPLPVILFETSAYRRPRLAARNAVIQRAGSTPRETDNYSTRDYGPTPYYPVTGHYDPALYMARGGRATAKWLEVSGYGDWETYEANKPD